MPITKKRIKLSYYKYCYYCKINVVKFTGKAKQKNKGIRNGNRCHFVVYIYCYIYFLILYYVILKYPKHN